jgi:CsoR family transcriptional regulator, copper-sensing transcriptional repressor
MKPDTKKDVAARLRSIAGHLKAVERMVDEDTYCVDVLKQTWRSRRPSSVGTP